jgi:cytochrome P450
MLQYYAPRLAGLISSLWPTKTRAVPGSKQYVRKMTDAPNPNEYTLMGKLSQKKSEMSSLDMSAECMDQMAAGIDTTGDGLCFLMWQLSQPESIEVQVKLNKELVGNSEASLNELPYLDAVVKEGLRCFPPIPMSLPRYVPAGGRTIDGYQVPEGTIVSCQAWSLNRVEDVFPEPEKFLPERWMLEKGVHERNAVFFSFAQGGRGCIGKK